ncbi:MAG: hypothetical protein KKA36_02820 [Gammaproteobacteria bacterium]|nr:hypothetical protein [Gammaproteobacteria bacterium]
MLEIAARANVAELRPQTVGMSILRERIDNAKLGAVMSTSFGFNSADATLISGNPPAKTLRILTRQYGVSVQRDPRWHERRARYSRAG